MRQLNSRHSALRFDESSRARKRFDMRVFPDSQINRTDAAIRRDSCSFGENKRRTAHRAGSEMHQVPVRGESVHARVLAHGRNDDAIAKSNFANCEWRE